MADKPAVEFLLPAGRAFHMEGFHVKLTSDAKFISSHPANEPDIAKFVDGTPAAGVGDRSVVQRDVSNAEIAKVNESLEKFKSETAATMEKILAAVQPAAPKTDPAKK